MTVKDIRCGAVVHEASAGRSQDAWSSAHSFARETRPTAFWTSRATAAHTPQQRHTERQVRTRFFTETVTETAT